MPIRPSVISGFSTCMPIIAVKFVDLPKILPILTSNFLNRPPLLLIVTSKLENPANSHKDEILLVTIANTQCSDILC